MKMKLCIAAVAVIFTMSIVSCGGNTKKATTEDASTRTEQKCDTTKNCCKETAESCESDSTACKEGNTEQCCQDETQTAE